MPDILEQGEVDALLSAVDEGEIDVEPEISQESLGAEVSVHDFKRPERVSKDSLRSIENLHEVFARNLGANLSGRLRTIVEVKLASVEQLTYSEFIMSLPNPTCFNLLSAAPLEGEMVLEVNPSIVFPVIDRLLGGPSSAASVPDRALTDIEQRLVSRIIDSALDQLQETWAAVKPVEFKVLAKESNPQLMQIVAPNEAVVLVCFEISMGEASGMMNLCIPFMVIEPIVGEFGTHHWFTYTRSEDDDFQGNIDSGLGLAPVEVVVELCQTSLQMREVLNMRPGDVITTEKPVGSEALIYVEGRPKFRGLLGQFRRHRAVQVTDLTSRRDGV